MLIIKATMYSIILILIIKDHFLFRLACHTVMFNTVEKKFTKCQYSYQTIPNIMTRQIECGVGSRLLRERFRLVFAS